MRNTSLLFVKSSKLYERVFFRMLTAFLFGVSILVFMPNSAWAATASDNFNRAGGGIGPNWEIFGGLGAPNIYSNAVGYPSTGTAVAADWIANSFGNDQFSQATITGFTPDDIWFVGAHLAHGPLSGYEAGISTAVSGHYLIDRWDNGTEVNLATSAQLAALNDVVRLKIQGTRLTLFVNGIAILTTTDSTYTSGNVGFALRGSHTSTGLLDNWSGGDLDGLVGVTSRSDILSDSRPSTTSNHTFAFTVNTAIYGSSVSGSSTLNLVFDPTFTIPAGMDCGDVDVATGSQFNFNWPSCQATATAWGFSATATGFVATLIPPTDSNVHVATGTPITIKIGSNATVGQQGGHWITNPSSGGVYTISVGGSFGGSGNILVSINSGVTVQATVAESLALTVSSVAAVNCTADDGATITAIGTSPTSVPFGTVSLNTFYIGCQDLVVSTNAGGGYSITTQESSVMKTVDGRFIIPDTTCDGGTCSESAGAVWTNATKNGLGHSWAYLFQSRRQP